MAFTVRNTRPGYWEGTTFHGPMPQEMVLKDPDLDKTLDAQTLGARNQQARFNQLFPWLQQQMGSLDPNAIGGATRPPPPIRVGGVFNPQQIQQQVNQSNANIAQQAATNVQDMRASLGGRGGGANSPLAMALAGQAQAGALGQRFGAATDIRNKAAELNAGQLLNTQQARSNQWAQREQLDIERLKPYYQLRSSLLGAISGLL